MLPVAALVIDARGGGGAAARILGAQVQLATDDGLDPAAVAEVFTEDAEERLRRSLGPAFDAAFQEGRSLDADEAVRQAVDLLSDGDASGRQSGARTPGA